MNERMPDGSGDCGDNGTDPVIRPLGKHRRAELPGLLTDLRTAVPVHMIKPPLFSSDEACTLLAEVIAEMGRVLAATHPAVAGQLPSTNPVRQCDRLFWLVDGTPMFYM